MRIINIISSILLGCVIASYGWAAGIYISVGWIPICNRLAIVGAVVLGLLWIISLHVTDTVEDLKGEGFKDFKNIKFGVQCVREYLDCSTKLQEGIREMIDALDDPETDDDDRFTVLVTLAEALKCDL